MLIIPALDIKGNKVVRLLKGDFNQEKVYSRDPLEIAFKLKQLGAKRIHIVDLDGAREGVPRNKEIIKEISASLILDLQVGGGIREESVISEYLAAGIRYLVVGTRAYLDPEWFKQMLGKYSESLILALDLVEGELKIAGWERSLGGDFLKYLEEFVPAGLKCLIYTEVSKDGTLQGVDLDLLEEFLRKTNPLNIKIIFSGGISSKDEIKKISQLKDERIEGVIIGKALYEGKIDLSEIMGGML